MLNCRQVTELCSQALDRDLRLTEKMSLSAHLLMCSGCANYRRQIQALRQMSRAYADGRAASPPQEDDSRNKPA